MQMVAKQVPGTGAGIEIRCKAPFAAGAVLWRDEAGRLVATIVAKATYRLAPGLSEVVDPPDPVRESDVFWDGDAAGKLRFASDLAPFKAAHEVLVSGHAHVSGATRARVAVGEIDKAVTVDGAPDAPLVGLGPVNPAWPQRDALLRPEDRAWLADPAGKARPRGFDLRYFCAAPADQRSDGPIRADARLILEGLHPPHGNLVTTLGGVAPALRSSSLESPPPFVADTLFIDLDRRIATVSFRAIVALDGEDLLVDVVSETSATPPIGRVDDATTELDRSALSEFLAPVLPFPPASEPLHSRGARAFTPSADDGALPFRASSPPPPPKPDLSAPPPEPPVEQARQAPPPPRSTVGQLQSLSRPAAATEEQAARGPTSEKDRFRKAFGASAFGSSAFGGSALGGSASKPASTSASAPAPVPAPSPEVTPPPGKAPAPIAVSAPAALESAPGAKAASDAAAALAARVAAVQAAPFERAAAITRRAIVDLLSFDRGVPTRLRRSKAYAQLLTDLDAPRVPRKVDAKATEEPEDRARLDVLRVLSCGAPLGAEDLDASFDALFEDPHELDVPLFHVQGECRPTMDELETLRLAVEVAKPLAGVNKRVLAAIAVSTEALARTAGLTADGAVSHYKRLEAATAELSLPPRHLADHVDRTLLEARSFKKRTLLGAPRIRAELTIGRLALPIYLPDSAASHLPLLPSFALAALVELRPREDASEQNPAALVAFALGRVLRTRGALGGSKAPRE